MQFHRNLSMKTLNSPWKAIIEFCLSRVNTFSLQTVSIEAADTSTIGLTAQGSRQPAIAFNTTFMRLYRVLKRADNGALDENKEVLQTGMELEKTLSHRGEPDCESLENLMPHEDGE